jgi:hypothetical protein
MTEEFLYVVGQKIFPIIRMKTSASAFFLLIQRYEANSSVI